MRQVPRAADNLDFFADYIGVMAGETFEQLGYQTTSRGNPLGGGTVCSVECTLGVGRMPGQPGLCV